jgi:hypothetical protein
MKQEITLQLQANEVGKAPYEFPAFSVNAHWTPEGKIRVLAMVIRTDGGVHIMQDIIDPPAKEQS